MKRLIFTGLFVLLIMPFTMATPVPVPFPKISLNDGWLLQSSSQVKDGGDAISTSQYRPQKWYPVTLPMTVARALVQNKVVPEPYFGMNLRKLPGVSYPIGTNFSEQAMAPDSPFAVSWWYRKTFVLPASDKGKTLWLNFKGINYRANIWLNGKQIGDKTQVAGAWRTYEFNITDFAKAGTNALAVEVFAPTETDLAITFVDWNPSPPDKNMGLFRDVFITTSGPVSLRYPTVISKVDSPANNKAHLSVTTLLKNSTDHPVKGTLKGQIEKVSFSQDVELAPGEEKDVAFEPDQYAELNLDQPRLWWPTQMGSPNLYTLDMQFVVDGKVSDNSHSRFGIRQIDSEYDANRKRVFSINGKKILIRGGGWSSDMMLKEDPKRLADEFHYVRDMGLNTIRLEGKLENEHFFDMADEQGILVMAGWCCCDFWEQWDKWQDEHYTIAKASLQSQIYRLRSHPSLVMWLNGSDNPPPQKAESMYLDVEKQCRWPNPIVSSATEKPAQFTGESGVKMTGPYEYVAPSYWTEDKSRGGAYGFNTETSMGPAVPPIESLKEMLPPEHLWPIDDYWNFHAGGNEFKDIHVFTEALDRRYGQAQSAEDFALKSQVMSYEGVRAMFEGYSRNKYTSTGVIQWMLNNAWPSMIWHLYDYYLRPGGGYFGTKKALEPLHPIFGYDDRSVSIVNSRYLDVSGLKLTAKILNLDMSEKWSQEANVDAPADSSNRVFTVPEADGLSGTYFLVLRLQDAKGAVVGSNFYWLSTTHETLDWAKSDWYVTPTATFADYTALNQLAKVKLKVTNKTERKGVDAITTVSVENPNKSLAFFVRLKVDKGPTGKEILPVIWQDNYFSLLPGEKRDITATYRAEELGSAQPSVEVSGWNVEK